MRRHLRRILKSSSGATSIEYALIAALVSVGAITAMGSLGTSLSGMLSHVSLQIAIPIGALADQEAAQCVEVDSSCNQ